MALPESWVDRIFDKLTLVYGSHFTSRWNGVDIAAVKGDWAHELAGFHGQSDAIKYALTHLPPDQPPNVMQFRAMCNKAPAPVFEALPAPESKPSQEVLTKVSELAKPKQWSDPKAWAWALRERELRHGRELPSGSMMTRAQLEMWRDALNGQVAA